jgi:hypothetical protein
LAWQWDYASPALAEPGLKIEFNLTRNPELNVPEVSKKLSPLYSKLGNSKLENFERLVPEPATP